MAALQVSKQRKKIWPWIFTIVLIIGLGLVSWYGYRWYMFGEEPPVIPVASADPRIEEIAIPEEMVTSHKVPSTHPRYVSIPKLEVSKTRVLAMGVDGNNQLEAPKNIHDVAWYSESAMPGDGAGAVLINGHNGGSVADGVFVNLKSLRVNDEIIVERGDRKVFTYRVVENESMHIDEVNKNGMKKMMKSADADSEGLNIITCDGNWVPRLQMFDRRIMLRAVLVQ